MFFVSKWNKGMFQIETFIIFTGKSCAPDGAPV